MKTLFKGSTIDECLEEASRDLNIRKEEIKYKVLKEKSRFFKKEAIIAVIIEEEDENLIELNGEVKVEDNNIIVTNPKEGGSPAYIMPTEGMTLKIDGTIVKDKTKVYEDSLIEVIFEEEIPKRNLSITTSENKIEAYMSIDYIPKRTYKLENVKSSHEIYLDKEIIDESMPPLYNLHEILEELSKMGIIYGIIEENIKNNVEKKCNNILIVKGKPPIDGEDDTIEYKFPLSENLVKIMEDDRGNVDFRNICSIKSVDENDVIGIRREGQPGEDGKNIFGKVLRHKPGKKVYLKVGEGCILKDDNTVVATLEGKPSTKNNVFYVYKLHEVKSDVDLTTGNVKFIGDVVIHGSVKEGMEVWADNSISIKKNTDRALINGKGDITIDGNIISSQIIGGGEDVAKLNYIDRLTEMTNTIESIIKATEEIKKYDIMYRNTKYGEIIKILVENKFNKLPRLCFQIMKDVKLNEDRDAEDTLIPIIKEKFLGLGPISIKDYRELEDIKNKFNYKISLLKERLAIPVNVQINYCQDSKINSTGNVYINGKGSYISDIYANDKIYFTREKSVVRGGTLKSKDEIKCGIVGSIGGVTTKLVVGESGHIWTKVAYQNTLFIVGQREYMLEIPCKDVHAYLDDKGDLTVDRLIL
ncbi:flagellar assembly protein A [uncultured Clostridium sp.]|uniref:DUF342 domain-containing protein n=1 Tax=uncultured Clostridium sp. TaxID=59620 RepID=UPI0028EDB104|nr:flagellar assembly protein A [uncultured Clostridium sp.]